MNVREYRSDDEIALKIGADGGGGFLKICLNIQIQSQSPSNGRKRMKLSDGVASKTLKDSGVKKLFILAIVPNVEENYTNVLTLWRLLQLTNPSTLSPYCIATDLKLANIMVGLMAHGSAHPCTWCDVAKPDLWSTGQLRTLGSIKEKFRDWSSAGGVLNKAKYHGNCVHEPIFMGAADKKVIDIIPLPELHLMIGPVNTLFNALIKKWPEALQWADTCSVTREAIHGGSFTGNSCRKLLRNVNQLEQMCPPECIPFVKTFQAFNRVGLIYILCTKRQLTLLSSATVSYTFLSLLRCTL